MKFKVGDKVRLVRIAKSEKEGNKKEDYLSNLNKVFTIERIHSTCEGKFASLKETFIQPFLSDLEKVFTKSDLKDGDVVTCRYGDRRTLIKNTFECHNLGKSTLVLENYNEDLTMKNENKEMDIIKVERPTHYKTVFERKEEILDEVEKEYLKGVIRPFRNKVRAIIKMEYSENSAFICIVLKDDSDMLFPVFKKEYMYKKMELDKHYTLKELEL